MSLPHSEFLGWEPDDREALLELKAWEAESCNDCGIHPSLWDRKLGGHPNRVVPTWRFCRVCELVGQADKAGPPVEGPGWHLGLKFNDV